MDTSLLLPLLDWSLLSILLSDVILVVAEADIDVIGTVTPNEVVVELEVDDEEKDENANDDFDNDADPDEL